LSIPALTQASSFSPPGAPEAPAAPMTSSHPICNQPTASPRSLMSVGVFCHEYRRSKRCCATIREMKARSFEVGNQLRSTAGPTVTPCRRPWSAATADHRAGARRQHRPALHRRTACARPMPRARSGRRLERWWGAGRCALKIPRRAPTTSGVKAAKRRR
jgi:hypothetical protein